MGVIYVICLYMFMLTEQNSFDMGMQDSSGPMFEVDHLATYTSKSGK
jgi:hypothetical protein